MAEIVAEVIRSNRIESVHRGAIAVCDADSKKIASFGDPERESYIRSAGKPIQVMPLLQSGAAEAYGFTEKELAVMMASHSGESCHIEAVRAILRKADLDVSDLGCGFHRPLNMESADDFVRSGAEPSAIYNNCSGKHAGMLAACTRRDWPIRNYLELDHPLQKSILKKVALFAGLDEVRIGLGIDGCSAPVFFLPVESMAVIYARLAGGNLSLSDRVFSIMGGHPEMIAGTGRFDTDFMRALKGRAISKIGAEGVRCVGFRGTEAIGVALKIEDGNGRVSAAVMLAVLADLGLLTAAELGSLSEYRKPGIKNCAGLNIGQIRAVVRF